MPGKYSNLCCSRSTILSCIDNVLAECALKNVIESRLALHEPNIPARPNFFRGDFWGTSDLDAVARYYAYRVRFNNRETRWLRRSE